MAYTLTRRHDSVVLETGVVGYLAAITRTEAYPNVDVIVHEDGTDWMEEKRKQGPNNTQHEWAYL